MTKALQYSGKKRVQLLAEEETIVTNPQQQFQAKYAISCRHSQVKDP